MSTEQDIYRHRNNLRRIKLGAGNDATALMMATQMGYGSLADLEIRAQAEEEKNTPSALNAARQAFEKAKELFSSEEARLRQRESEEQLRRQSVDELTKRENELRGVEEQYAQLDAEAKGAEEFIFSYISGEVGFSPAGESSLCNAYGTLARDPINRRLIPKVIEKHKEKIKELRARIKRLS
jgi:hypothetical protein